MNKAYSALSKVYEYLICDCDYQKWSQYILFKLKSLNAGNTIVDCACGSGFFTRNFKINGYDVIGVDISQEMLSEAQLKTAQMGLNIQYLLMDMLKLKLFKRVGVITIINDAVNYIPPEKLQTLFRTMHSSLEKGGILAFDFSSEYKIKNIIGNNLFGEDSDDCSYLWFNKLCNGYVEMDISVFTREGEFFQKKEEQHRQYIHTVENISNALMRSRFEIIEISEHLGQPLTKGSQRIQIFAKRA